MPGKERPPVPEIPGLQKGGDFLKGRKIELQRELWASRRRATFTDRKADLLVISKDKEYFLNLPVLGIYEPETTPVASWAPRFEPSTGDVYTTRWEQFDRSLNPEKFVVFGGRKNAEGLNLALLPKSWDVPRLVPQQVSGGLEAAMRQQDEIRHDFSAKEGVEQKRVEEVLMGIHVLTDVFVHKSITSEILEALARQTEGMLKKEGLLSAKDSIWRIIVDFTIRAAKKDSLNRNNPTASRILARAAFLRTVDRELILREVKTKADRLYRYLGMVRIQTRNRITDASDTLDRIGGLGKEMGHPAFREGRRWLSTKEAWQVGRVVRAVSDDILGLVQAAPYLVPARLAEAMLTGKIGKYRGRVERIKATLANSGVEQELERDSVEDYLRRGDGTSAQKRMRHAYTVLKEVLADPDHLEVTVFD